MWCQLSFAHKDDRVSVWTGPHSAKGQLLSPHFLCSGLLPSQSSQLRGLVVMVVVVGCVAGEFHSIWVWINSMLVFLNCCLYQVARLRLTSELLPGDGYFLYKYLNCRIIVCFIHIHDCSVVNHSRIEYSKLVRVADSSERLFFWISINHFHCAFLVNWSKS